MADYKTVKEEMQTTSILPNNLNDCTMQERTLLEILITLRQIQKNTQP